MVNIAHYLDPELVSLLEGETRDQTISALVQSADAAGKLLDKNTFFNAILEREKVVSTGIGLGIAIPHAKLPDYNHFFISIGILKKGVDWKALDHKPVRLVFLIGGPDDKQTEYLQILSHLTLALRDEERRNKLLRATSPEEAIAAFDNVS